MPFVAAALVPHPPLLVPELANGAARELDGLRAACAQALDMVVDAAGPIVVVGDGPCWGQVVPGAAGTFAPFGVDVRVGLSVTSAGGLEGVPEPVALTKLPLSLTVAAWLLGERDCEELFAFTVPATLGPGACAAVGGALAASVAGRRRAGIVVMGDMPAWPEDGGDGGRAGEDFETCVRDVFTGATPADLLALDPAIGTELAASARGPLQVLAGAFGAERALRGKVLFEHRPYGVGYLVGILEAA